MPTLTEAEVTYGIPSYLLARVAYQESRFRADVIDGSVVSPAGAVGLMQLLPQYFPNAGESVPADIAMAAESLVGAYQRFGDWQLALASYNWGGGNVHHEYMVDGQKYVLADFPKETRDYVTQIVADVPVSGALIQLST